MIIVGTNGSIIPTKPSFDSRECVFDSVVQCTNGTHQSHTDTDLFDAKRSMVRFEMFCTGTDLQETFVHLWALSRLVYNLWDRRYQGQRVLCCLVSSGDFDRKAVPTSEDMTAVHGWYRTDSGRVGHYNPSKPSLPTVSTFSSASSCALLVVSQTPATNRSNQENGMHWVVFTVICCIRTSQMNVPYFTKRQLSYTLLPGATNAVQIPLHFSTLQ